MTQNVKALVERLKEVREIAEVLKPLSDIDHGELGNRLIKALRQITGGFDEALEALESQAAKIAALEAVVIDMQQEIADRHDAEQAALRTICDLAEPETCSHQSDIPGLINRLRGKYSMGPHLPNGDPEFGWRQFQATPINLEAANALEAQRHKIAALKKLDSEAVEHVEMVIAMRTGFTGDEPYVGWKGLGLALSEALDERDRLAARVAELEAAAQWKPTHRHYKGGLYRLIGLAHHSETLDHLAVYEDSQSRLWVRPRAMFEETDRFSPLPPQKETPKMPRTFSEFRGRPILWRDQDGEVHVCEGSEMHPGIWLLWTLCQKDVPANAAFHADPGDQVTCEKCLKAKESSS